MLILLPPSETKRAGGTGRPLDLSSLAYPQLRPEREAVVSALVALSGDADAAARVLKLSERQRGEIDVNAAFLDAPTMPAVDRYTGVLYDALDASGLDAPARRWLGSHVLIHSAPLGPIGALDRVPAYRLSGTAVLPGLAPLRKVWADAVTAAIDGAAPSFILDLRSEAYAALGPIPDGMPSAYIRIVDGNGRALNHFNKHTKGALVRRMAQERPRIGSRRAFVKWARSAGWPTEIVDGELAVSVAHDA
jgi:cytoplasmic iron level regulating protein YaaA (DUF328/UPF0246 family)